MTVRETPILKKMLSSKSGLGPCSVTLLTRRAVLFTHTWFPAEGSLQSKTNGRSQHFCKVNCGKQAMMDNLVRNGVSPLTKSNLCAMLLSK